MKIMIRWGAGELAGTLNDTPNAKAIYTALPIESMAYTWGEEVYFDAPVEATLAADAQEVVVPGTICYWTPGKCLALPYGRTPISEGNECRLASPCNILGHFDGDPRLLATVQDGEMIRVKRG